MIKLRQIGRRISMLSSWIAAFDAVVDMTEDNDSLSCLEAVRKTAHGIMIELESSRHHCQQKVNKNNWERSLNSALEFGLSQLKEFDTGDNLDASTLSREVELLKANAEREALLMVGEQDKLGDAVTAQVLIQAHFETIAAISRMNKMTVDEAVEKATDILAKMLSGAVSAVSHVVKPDGSLAPVEAFAPRKQGTPKRRKQYSLLAENKTLPVLNPVGNVQAVSGTPVRASPRKRAMLGSAKKGVQLSFTPKKRKSPMKNNKRAVRWKDDTEDGPLAEYKTPQKFTPSPAVEEVTTELPAMSELSELSSFAQRMESSTTPPSSPLPSLPETGTSFVAKNDRFKAGFLSRRSEGSPDPSFLPAAPRITIFSSSDGEDSPLREISENSALPQSNSTLPEREEESALASSSDAENQDPSQLATKLDTLHIRSAGKRNSSVRYSGISKAHRRRSPTAATASSPPQTGEMFGAGHVRRMVMPPSTKIDGWKPSVLSPRTEGITSHHRVTSGSRRTTMGGSGEQGHSRGMSVGERAALRLSSISTNNLRQENQGSGSRTSWMPSSKTVWR